MSAAREYGLDDQYEWARPPDGGWISEDLDQLPNLPSHTELIDGSLVLRCPQNVFHCEGLPVVYAYELDPATKAYFPVGIFRKELKADRPFLMEIDLAALNRRR